MSTDVSLSPIGALALHSLLRADLNLADPALLPAARLQHPPRLRLAVQTDETHAQSLPHRHQLVSALLPGHSHSNGHSSRLVLQSRLLRADHRAVHERMPSTALSLLADLLLRPARELFTAIDRSLPSVAQIRRSRLPAHRRLRARRDRGVRRRLLFSFVDIRDE